jgi:hypothetical protein
MSTDDVEAEAATEAEAAFDAAMARAGVTVPEQWRSGTLASFLELRALADLVHDASRPVAHEPSGAYRMQAQHG